jgi:hypothetical protein
MLPCMNLATLAMGGRISPQRVLLPLHRTYIMVQRSLLQRAPLLPNWGSHKKSLIAAAVV